MASPRPPTADRLVHRRLARVPRTPDGLVDLDGLLAAVPGADLLESPRNGGWSYLVPPVGATVVDDGARTVLNDPDGATTDLGEDPFAALDLVAERFGLDPHAARDPELPPFTGGLVGAFGYDLARRVERVPTRASADRDLAHLWLRLVELVVAVDPARAEASLIGRDLRGTGELPTRVAELTDHLARAARPTGLASQRAPDTSPDTWPGTSPAPIDPATHTHTTLAPDRHRAAIEVALDAIAAGELFQVNLTQRLTAAWSGDLVTLYRALRTVGPAPHGALLTSPGIASVSPETFLAVDAGAVTTRPIKGTRRRDPDPARDAELAAQLVGSAKDRAENVMIVDLLRNDLGRVARIGTVAAGRVCELEAHPTVWHLVSTVTGQLAGDVGYGGLLRATFPCGSITGAPKVAAMALIERLEPVRRGWYCGALGYLGVGAASLSVAIRTAVLAGGRADWGAGGGIVADSVPGAEVAESRDKAAAFLRAIGAVPAATGAPTHPPFEPRATAARDPAGTGEPPGGGP